MVKYSRAMILMFLFLVGTVGIANADAVYNFDNPHLIDIFTPFSLASNGVTATFSSDGDPGGFIVRPSSLRSPTLTGNILQDPGPAGLEGGPGGLNHLILDITFSADISSIFLDFAINNPFGTGTLTLLALENGVPVDAVSASGKVPNGATFPQGAISLSGVTFNEVALSSPELDIAVDNIAVPEPESLLLLASGVAGLFAAGRRKLPA